LKKRKHWMAITILPLLLMVKAIRGTLKALSGRGERSTGGKSFTRHKHIVEVGDGVRLKASVFVPAGEGPFPAVIMVHSWGFWRIQPDLMYAPAFARAGYVVLTYDCRGWGSSGGQVCCAAPDKELRDLGDMITWLTSPESGAPVDPERIGMTGISYGGGHSFLAAAREKRIKAAAPMNGWVDLYHSLMPNNCWKAVVSIFLFASSLWAIKLNRDNVLLRWLKGVIKWEGMEEIKEELGERSAINEVDNVTCPMFICHSWNDDVFEPNQILDFYQRLNVPKKLIMTNGLHGFDPGRGEFLFPNRIWEDVRRFFDYWLKDERDNGIMEEPPISYYQAWDQRMVSADAWPPEGVKGQTYFLRRDPLEDVNAGRLEDEAPGDDETSEQIINNTVTSGHWSGFSIVRLNALNNLPIPGVPFSIPGDSASFTSAPLDADTVMVGAPSVKLDLASSTNECQANALLFDVSPRGFPRLVTHCAYMKEDMEPDTVESFQFELIACAHRFRAGHRIRLVVCACDPMYVFPSRVPSAYRLFHSADNASSLTVPVMQGDGA